MSRFKMETSPLVKNSFKGKRNEREKIPFNGLPDSTYNITGGPNLTYDMNGQLVGYSGQPGVTGGRWATTVAEGAVLGPELVTNGDFSNGLTGWVNPDISRGTLSIEEGKLKVINDGDSSYPNASNMTVPTEVGKTFLATAKVEKGTGTLMELRAFADGVLGNVQTDKSGTIEFVFTATASTTTIIAYLFEAGNTGHYCYFDNISVREVIPQWVPTVGPNLVANGDFSDGTTGWTDESSGTGTALIVDGRLELYRLDVNNRGALSQVIGGGGKTYLLSFDKYDSDAQLQIKSGDISLDGADLHFIVQTAGHYDVVIYDVMSTLYLLHVSNGKTAVIDNISVREVPANYAPWKEKLGSELIVNGAFTNWTNDTLDSWTNTESGANVITETNAEGVPTVGGGHLKVYSADGVNTYVSQFSILTAGKRYRVTGIATKIYGNGVKITVGADTADSRKQINTVGAFSFDMESLGTGASIVRYSAAGDGAVLSGISYKEVLPDYTTTDATSLFPYELVRGQKLYTDIEYKYFAARTNLLRYSQEFDNAAWSKQYLTINANSAVAPDGTTTSDKLVATAVNDIHQAYTTLSMADNTDYWVWCHFKPAEVTRIGLVITNKTGTVTYAYFNSLTESFDYVVAALDTYWEKCGDYYIVGVKLASGTGAATTLARIRLTSSGNDSFLGDGVMGAYVWGAQHESNAISWYIPTTSATVTKPAGVYSRLNPNYFERMLVEKSATNLFLYSENFTSWTQTNVSLTMNQDVAPDGTTTASKMLCSAGRALHDISSGVSPTIGTEYTRSYYLKYGNHRYAQLSIGNQLDDYVNVDLLNGNALSYGNATSSIKKVANGYYRVSITFTADNATVSPIVGMVPSYTSGRRAAWTAAGTEYIYIWGAQNEVGPIATSYIKTSGATVTRQANVCSHSTERLIRGNNWGIWGQVIPGASGQSNADVFSSKVDFANFTNIFFIGGDLYLRKFIDSASILAGGTQTHTVGVPFQYQAYLSSVYGMGIRVRYWLGLAWSTWTSWATNADTQDAPIAETFQIGSRAGTYHFAGNYQMLRTYWSADPKAWLESQG